MRLIKNNFASILILGVAVFVSAVILVKAQTVTSSVSTPASTSTVSQPITFPVPELGNCTSRDDCKNYCNQPTNMGACISFAKAHGLMNEDEADRAEGFRRALAAGAGPGGCKTDNECQSFCSDIKNLDVCLDFARKQGFKDKNIDEGEKISAYIKAGGKLPGGCISKESCEAYCADFSHAQECYEFATKAGITQVRGEAKGVPGGIPPGQFQKFLELARKGETPGGCKSKDDCENYCQAPGHLNECLKFGEEMGFIQSDQAEKIRKLGGRGPGGCNSDASCSAYCNISEHQEECFNFAKEHGLISDDEIKQAKEGMARLREGLASAPPEVVSCLKSELGPNVIDDIQSGKLTPGPQIGDEVRGCFEKFGHRGDPGEVFKNVPPEVLSCLKDKLGDSFDKIRSGGVTPTPQMADAFRICFQSIQLQGRGPGGPGGPPAGAGQPSPDMISNFLRTAPPEVTVCLKEKLGDDADKIKSSQQPSPDAIEKVKECFQKFRPQANPQMMPEREFREPSMMNPGQQPGFQGSMPGGFNFRNFPPAAVDCVKNLVGGDAYEEIQKGGEVNRDVQSKISSCFQQYMQNQPRNQQPIQGFTPPPSSLIPPSSSQPQPQPQPIQNFVSSSLPMMPPGVNQGGIQPPTSTPYYQYQP